MSDDIKAKLQRAHHDAMDVHEAWIAEVCLAAKARIAEIEAALGQFANAVERLAFEMPPPNVWTPQFMQLAQSAKLRMFQKST